MTETFTKSSLKLLKDLEDNNNRDWYLAHKKDFEAQLLTPFADTLEAVTLALQAHEMDFSGGKKTMFRMNRDVRFSKDKSPYKTNISGMLTPSGTKAEGNGFIYLQLSSDGGFAAFGRYNLNAKALGPIRDRIIEQPKRFQEILTDLHNKDLDLDRSASLSSMPRGFAEHSDHPNADELKLTNMMVRLDVPLSAWTSDDVVSLVAETALNCRKFIAFVTI